MIPDHWTLRETGEYFELITDYVANGSFKSLSENVNYNEGDGHAVLIRLTDYKNHFDGEFITINKKAYDFLSKSHLSGGEIIISNVGDNVGTVFLAPKINRNMVLGPNSIMIRTGSNDLFFYYWFMSKNGQNSLKSIVTGSAQPKFNKTSFRRLFVPVPPVAEQEKIVNILSLLDNKIELNNKINSNLEELAQTLYKHWFVDFEFPNEEGKPYKSSGGEMVESELGMIPRGWEVKKVSELFVFIGGSQPPKSEHIYEAKDGYVRFLQNRDYRDNSNHLTYIKVAKRNKLAEKYDILMDKYGEVGQIRFGLEGAYNVALAKIEPIDSVDLEYLRGYFSQKSITTYLENSSIASTRGSLNATTFTGLKVPYPSNELRFSFSEIQFKALELILNFKSQNQQLSTLRDLLLPKLMSGEIEV